jgi:hypothetical protein
MTPPNTKRDAAQYSDIYESFIERSSLTQHDRDTLQQVRGFDHDTIEQLRFRSRCDANMAIVTDLIAQYGASRVRECGLSVGSRANPKLLPQEGRDHTLIPFLSDGKPVYIRPHKDAFSGLAMPFYTLPIKERSIIILTESEFKAAAAWQMGYSAIGIAGIQYASKNNYDALKEYLTANSLNIVCIIFDNEKKDVQGYPNYKPHFWDRYDTQYYAYLMATKLCANGFEASVGVLPEKWMADGKIDIDGALAAGHGRQDFMAVVNKRLTPEEYLNSLDDDVRQLLARRLQRSTVHVPLYASANHYWADRTVKDVTIPTAVSDFVFSIDSNIYTPSDECLRELTLTNHLGDVAKATFKADDFAHFLSFRKAAMGVGDFLYNGTQKDLEHIMALETSREVGKSIRQIDHCGWAEDAGMYLFQNGGLTPSGERVRLGEDGIVWRGLNGYQPIPLEQNAVKKKMGMPVLHHEDVEIEPIIDMIEENYSGFPGIRLGCAWLLATLVSHRICNLYENVFPILFLAGEAQSGKSTFAKWLCAMAGMKSEGYDYNAGSLVGMSRGLGYYSSQPFWLDEFRNSAQDKAKEKGNFLRSAYDGQSVLKGVRQNFGVRGSVVRGRIILSGQDTPADNALQQRCVTITMLGRNRRGSKFDELNTMAPTFSGIIPTLLRRWFADEKKGIAGIRTMRNHLRESGLDDRTAITYSIPLGVYDTVVKSDYGFFNWCGAHASAAFKEKESEKPNRMFLRGIQTMLGKNLLNGNAIKQTSKGELAIHFGVAFSTWCIMLRQQGTDFAFKERTLIDEIEQQDYFIQREKTVRMGEQNVGCLILNPEKDDVVAALYGAAELEREFK